MFNHNLVRALAGNDPKPDRKVLYIGVSWPSHPTTAGLKGDEAAAQTFAERIAASKKLREENPAAYFSDVQSALAETDPKAAAKLGELVEDLESNKSLADTSSDASGEAALPSNVLEKVVAFSDLLSPEAEVAGSVSPIDNADAPSSEAVLKNPTASLVVGSRPGLIRPDAVLGKPPQGVAQMFIFLQPLLRLFGWAPPLGIAYGAKALTGVLERIFFAQFERRAAMTGSRGVNQMIRTLMRSSGRKTRFHLVGHSLGCHVQTSAAIGSPPAPLLPRKLHSITLLQGAVPVVSYATEGSYRPLASTLLPVAGPVIATTSEYDMALENYSTFHGDPLGRDGFQGLDDSQHERCVLPSDASVNAGFQKGKFYTVLSGGVINETSDFLGLDLDGAHGDLLDPELMSRVWEAIDVQVDEGEYDMPRVESLPRDYWGTDVRVRRGC